METRSKQILTGCGIGCLAIVLLVIGSCVGFTVWLDRPAELLEPEQLLADDAVGYLEWTFSLEDPATERFVMAFIERMQSSRQEVMGEVPSWLRYFFDLEGRRNRRQIERMFPSVLVWTLTPGADAETDIHLFTIGAEQFGNRLVIADWILGLVARRLGVLGITEYRGERIYEFESRTSRPSEPQATAAEDVVVDESIVMFLRRGELHIANDVAAAKRAIDRLLGEASPSAGAADTTRWFAVLPSERSLRAAVSNERGELLRIRRKLLEDRDDREVPPDARVWQEVRGLTLEAGFAGDDELAGGLEIYCRSAARAQAMAVALTDQLRDDLAIESIELGTPTTTGDRVRIPFRFTDLFAFFDAGRHIELEIELEEERAPEPAPVAEEPGAPPPESS